MLARIISMNVYVPVDDLYKLEASLGVDWNVNLLKKRGIDFWASFKWTKVF